MFFVSFRSFVFFVSFVTFVFWVSFVTFVFPYLAAIVARMILIGRKSVSIPQRTGTILISI